MTWSVYEIRCTANDCVYVGRSTDPSMEWRKHRWRLRTSRHTNVELQSAWDFYHTGDFTFKVVAAGIDQAAADRLVEQLIVGALCDGLAMNWTIGVKASFNGRRHSDATRLKLAEASRGKVRTHRRRVVVYGVAYESLAEAGKGIGLSAGSVLHRIRSPDWAEWQYADAS